MSPTADRPQTLGEEIANSVSHGVGLIGVVAMAPFIMGAALEDGSAMAPLGAGIFVATAALVYLASTLYHSLAATRARRVLQVLDHSAIFLLIAGTYTPFTLGVLRGGWGWTLLGLVWSLAAGGVALKAVAGVRHPGLSTGLYVGMGWLALIAVRPLWAAVPVEGLLWLLAGGMAYTGGVVFFAVDHRIRYSHFIWHLFVLAGTACHAVAVLWYAR